MNDVLYLRKTGILWHVFFPPFLARLVGVWIVYFTPKLLLPKVGKVRTDQQLIDLFWRIDQGTSDLV